MLYICLGLILKVVKLSRYFILAFSKVKDMLLLSSEIEYVSNSPFSLEFENKGVLLSHSYSKEKRISSAVTLLPSDHR